MDANKRRVFTSRKNPGAERQLANDPTIEPQRTAIDQRLAEIADQIAKYLEHPRVRTPEKLFKIIEERSMLEKRLSELQR
jgi:hypothetical protein